MGARGRAEGSDRGATDGGAAQRGLATEFAGIALGLADARDLPALFAKIVETASRVVVGGDHCGVSVERRRKARTVASSDPVAAQLDAIQNDVGEGPGLAALRSDYVYEVDDVPAERRWPRFAARAAAETPVRSILSYRLFVEDRTVGVLNVFAYRPHAFDLRSHEHASLLAAHAAVAVVSGQDVRDLRLALDSRDLISTAKGILMEREGVTAEVAFEMLRRASRRSNAPLRDLAAQITDPDGSHGSRRGDAGTSSR